MSGIYGLYQQPDTFSATASLSGIRPWNEAYGRDRNEEYLESPSCALGICWEHITSSPRNNTPVLRYHEYRAVIDAVIYNRDELIASCGYSSELSDEELLLQLICSEGADCLAKVNGDFCGAIYNTQTDSLTLFRDHCGVRPLFVYSQAEWLSFSSDIRGLLALPQVPAKVNERWLYANICGYDTADFVETEVEGISFLRPASYLIISRSDKGLTYDEHIYWTLGSTKIRLSSEQAYMDRLRELLTDSVSRRASVYPGALGVELSGGLDSGVIAILISRLGREGLYYSWSPSPEDIPMAVDDERQVIADICQQENITCHYGTMELDLSPTSNVGRNHVRLGLVPDYSLAAEYNYALPPYINTMIICETSQFVSSSGGHVVFSGHGGDEGVSHRCDPFEMLYHHEYLHYFQYMWGTNKGKSLRLLRSIKHCIHKAKIGRRHVHQPFNTGCCAPQIMTPYLAGRFNASQMSPLTFAFDSVKYFYSGNTHNRLDVAALLSAYSEARYIFPYVDYRLLDYAVSIPRHLYLRPGINRYIYREAFKDLMPESLYRCTAKNNPSSANIKEEPSDWFVNFDHHRRNAMQKLDREYWKAYLDLDYLDKWCSAPRPADEDQEANIDILRKLLVCLHIQKVFEQVKGLP